MNMTKFIKNESGAVTADWVLLSACAVVMAVTVIMNIPPALETVGNGIGDYMDESQAGNGMFIQGE